MIKKLFCKKNVKKSKNKKKLKKRKFSINQDFFVLRLKISEEINFPFFYIFQKFYLFFENSEKSELLCQLQKVVKLEQMFFYISKKLSSQFFSTIF
mgnify:CR=1 FL=1